MDKKKAATSCGLFNIYYHAFVAITFDGGNLLSEEVEKTSPHLKAAAWGQRVFIPLLSTYVVPSSIIIRFPKEKNIHSQ